MALHTNVDIGDAQVALSQLGRRFAPRHNAGVWRKIELRLGPPLNSVVGERGVAAVLGIAAWHVAAEAVVSLAGWEGEILACGM